MMYTGLYNEKYELSAESAEDARRLLSVRSLYAPEKDATIHVSEQLQSMRFDQPNTTHDARKQPDNPPRPQLVPKPSRTSMTRPSFSMGVRNPQKIPHASSVIHKSPNAHRIHQTIIEEATMTTETEITRGSQPRSPAFPRAHATTDKKSTRSIRPMSAVVNHEPSHVSMIYYPQEQLYNQTPLTINQMTNIFCIDDTLYQTATYYNTRSLANYTMSRALLLHPDHSFAVPDTTTHSDSRSLMAADYPRYINSTLLAPDYTTSANAPHTHTTAAHETPTVTPPTIPCPILIRKRKWKYPFE
jgi:hypothetical protein